jgi:dTDP-4-dehydrorhamnose reductase
MRAEAELPTLWITGAGGLIGHHFARAAAAQGRWNVIPLTRADLDLLDAAAVQERFRRERPAAVVHCAALSKTPACQADPGLARRCNVEVTRQLAGLAGDGRFVFFSTDLIFDGRGGNYAENAPPNPLHVYGETKVAAETAVRAHPRHLIVRTSLNYGTSPTGDRSFAEEMLLAVRAGKTLSLFADEFRSPLTVEDTVATVIDLLAAGATGTYHVAGLERLSRWEIGEAVAAHHPELQGKLRADSLRHYQGPPRAPDTSLDCGKTVRLLGRAIPGLRERLGPKTNDR